jgi:hypothetical protein
MISYYYYISPGEYRLLLLPLAYLLGLRLLGMGTLTLR